MNNLIYQVKKQIIYHSPLNLKLDDLNLDKYIFKDFNIYGDDFEELIFCLSNELNFNFNKFFNKFDKKYYNPSESYFNLHKLFYIDIFQLFKGKLIFTLNKNKGIDISLKNLINLISEIKKTGSF